MPGGSAGIATHAATFACGQCGASLAFAGVRTEACPYCTSPNFVERPPTAGQPRPALAIAFTGDATTARRAIDRWLGSRTWFADARIKRARVEDLRGVYVPAYLYSAVAHTDYAASIGEHYATTETYRTTDRDGRKTTATRRVTRSEYRPLAGHHVGYVTDLLVSASAGLTDAELHAVEPFELRQLRRFSPALIAGWITEEFARDPDTCRRISRGDAVEEVGIRLRRFLPGDSHSDLSWRTRVEWESLDPVLVPVWVLAVRYRDDRPLLRVVINGQTGAIAGKVPLAWWKVTLAVVVAAAVLATLIVLGREPDDPADPPPPASYVVAARLGSGAALSLDPVSPSSIVRRDPSLALARPAHHAGHVADASQIADSRGASVTDGGRLRGAPGDLAASSPSRGVHP